MFCVHCVSWHHATHSSCICLRTVDAAVFAENAVPCCVGNRGAVGLWLVRCGRYCRNTRCSLAFTYTRRTRPPLVCSELSTNWSLTVSSAAYTSPTLSAASSLARSPASMLNCMMVLSRVLCLRAWQKLNTRLMSASITDRQTAGWRTVLIFNDLLHSALSSHSTVVVALRCWVQRQAFYPYFYTQCTC